MYNNSSIRSVDQYEISAKISNRIFFDNNNQYIIPFLQRSYQWEIKQLEMYIKDLYRLENNECSSLGEITLFTENSNSTSIREISIWDGQQRVITCYLFLVAMRNYILSIKNKLSHNKQKIVDRYINTINDYIFRKEYELSDIELKQTKKDKNKILKIKSNHSPDNNVLIDIFNMNLNNSNILYTINDDDKKFSCKICGSKYKILGDNMIKHLLLHNKDNEKNNDFKEQYELIKYLNKDGFIIDNNLHPLIIAYEYLYNQIKLKFDKFIEEIGDISPYEKLLFQFLDNWLHEERMCKNIEYACQSFEQLNARGKSLEHQDMLRSLLISKVSEEDREKYFNLINTIFEFASDYKISKNRDLTISLLFNLTRNKFNHNDTILGIGSELFVNISDNITKILNYTIMLKELENFIKRSNYGTIIQTDVMGEIFSNVIVPTYIKLNNKKKNFDKILEIIACFQIITCTSIKNIQSSKTKIKEFADDILNNKYSDDVIIFKTIELILNIQQIQKIITEIDSAKVDLKNIDKFQHLYKMLYFIECRKTPNGVYYNSNAFDIEHIMPKHNNNNIENINKIGNLTIFESKNSDNHKGNRSIKDKSYSEKIKQYKKSNVRMTNEIADKYDTWDVNKIDERTNELINFMVDEIFKILKINNSSSSNNKNIKIKKTVKKPTKKVES